MSISDFLCAKKAYGDSMRLKKTHYVSIWNYFHRDFDIAFFQNVRVLDAFNTSSSPHEWPISIETKRTSIVVMCLR